MGNVNIYKINKQIEVGTPQQQNEKHNNKITH